MFSPDVYINDRKLLRLKNRRYATLEVEAGEYDVGLKRTRQFGTNPETISLTAEPGHVYFFRFTAHKHTIFNLDRTARQLHQVPWKEGEEEIVDCTYVPLVNNGSSP